MLDEMRHNQEIDPTVLPEIRLLAGVVIKALKDVNSRRVFYRNSARNYVRSQDFEYHCGILDLPFEDLRKRVVSDPASVSNALFYRKGAGGSRA